MKKYMLLPLAALLAACNSGEVQTTTEIEEPVARVVEYSPAPGQFINEPLSGFDNLTTPAQACAYAEKRMATGNYISLGGWGGYIVAAFATPVPNTGGYELYVTGNSFNRSSEPGIVWVAPDADADGQPDRWYQLQGSEYANSVRDYRITYHRPAGDKQAVAWEDNKGNSGTIDRIASHTQASYFPDWMVRTDKEKLEFNGPRLPDNVGHGEAEDEDGNPVSAWIAEPFAWGYADNFSSSARRGTTNYLRISDAVTETGAPANLTRISFIKVQTGVNTKAPEIGEISTDVCGMGCVRIITSK